MSWEEKRLGDVLSLKRGYDLTEAQRKPGDVPVVSSSGITGSHNMAMVDAPGVVTGRYGTMGQVFYVERDFWPHNTALYVSDFKGNNPRFIAYFLKNALRGTNSNKAAVPGVNRNDLHERKVLAPDISTQGRIVEHLQSLDDLIENNRRRIALLEQSARMLYREWFVHLRFPGHEHVKVVDGVPEGWEKHKLAEISNEIRVAVAPEKVASGTPYIGLEHMPRRSITLSDWGHSDDITSQKFAYMAGDILFGKIRPYFHKVGFTLTDGITSSDAIVIRPIDHNHYHFLLLLLSSDQFVALASQTVKEGSKMPRADWKFLRKQDFPVPPDELLRELSAVCGPITEQLKALANANEKLRQARDLLLPRLMSGELAV